MANYRDTLPKGVAFPTSVTWYRDAGLTSKSIENVVTWSGARITQQIFRVYAEDGVTLIRTTVYDYDYSAGFLTPSITVTES